MKADARGSGGALQYQELTEEDTASMRSCASFGAAILDADAALLRSVAHVRPVGRSVNKPARRERGYRLRCQSRGWACRAMWWPVMCIGTIGASIPDFPRPRVQGERKGGACTAYLLRWQIAVRYSRAARCKMDERRRMHAYL